MRRNGASGRPAQRPGVCMQLLWDSLAFHHHLCIIHVKLHVLLSSSYPGEKWHSVLINCIFSLGCFPSFLTSQWKLHLKNIKNICLSLAQKTEYTIEQLQKKKMLSAFLAISTFHNESSLILFIFTGKYKARTSQLASSLRVTFKKNKKKKKINEP